MRPGDPRRALVGYVTGPTATGKTEAALQIAQARGWSILSVDSRQIYRRLEIGTAKPTAAARARVDHLLVDALEPHEACSAGRFRELALEALASASAAGRRVLAVGGAGFYWEALVQGLHPLPRADAATRARHEAIASQEGPEALHGALARVDPETAARLSPRDRQRIGRALEIYEVTGVPMSRLLRESAREGNGPIEVPVVALVRARPDLYGRIEARCRAMLEAGLVAEVAGLLREGLAPDAPGLKTVGYREFVPHCLEGAPVEPCIDRFVRESRRYAKRQETWIRHRIPGRTETDAGAAARELQGRMAEAFDRGGATGG